jgi:chemotaxis protein CheZ
MLPNNAIAQILTGQLEQIASLSMPPDARMVEALMREMITSLKGDLTADDIRVYGAIKELSESITKMREEIAGLNPGDIAREAIPTATDELEAVVVATEEATSKILDAADKISRVADELANTPAADHLTRAITTIYEASNFQDITGQRITKVVKTLQKVEEKIAEMLAVFGDTSLMDAKKTGSAAQKPSAPAASSTDAQSLMNGPQLPGNATSQDDIDALFDSL